MFLQWCGDVLPKIYIFVQRFVSGTGRGFETAPLRKHKRYAKAPRRRMILNSLKKKHPAPLLISVAAFQNYFTVAWGQGRMRQFVHHATRHCIATGEKPH
jgi:hypothetical protein